MIPVENQIYSSDFFGSGDPNKKTIIARAGVQYTDVASLIRYRQQTTPNGRKWIVVATNVVVDMESEDDDTIAWLGL